MIHVKEVYLAEVPLCGLPVSAQNGELTWTSCGTARKMATCPECLSEVLRSDCTECNGSGFTRYSGCKSHCIHCDIEYAESFIIDRDAPPRAAGERNKI